MSYEDSDAKFFVLLFFFLPLKISRKSFFSVDQKFSDPVINLEVLGISKLFDKNF